MAAGHAFIHERHEQETPAAGARAKARMRQHGLVVASGGGVRDADLMEG